MGLVKLLGLCVSMFLGAFLCGEVPLRCPMSPRHMKAITTIGVGLLIGVSFVVIIPEGVHTYYGAKAPTMHTPAVASLTKVSSHDHSHETANYGHQNAHLGDHDHTTEEGEHDESEVNDHSGHDHSSGGEHVHEECVDLGRSSSAVGLALVAGFVVMFLVDRISGGEEGHAHGADSPGHGHGHGHTPTSHIHVQPSANTSTAAGQTQAAGNHEHVRHGDSPPPISPSAPLLGDDSKPSQQLRINPLSPNPDDPSLPPAAQFDQTATFGILVHSAIDGLALGAISVSDNSSLELVVFMAIILHKAPAAFGLTSFLLHQGRTTQEVRKHLLYFSLAAPLTSLATFLVFGFYNSQADSAHSLSASSADGQALLGLCLLFSAGTFLFTIAVHILPEIHSAASGSGSASSSGSAGGQPGAPPGTTQQAPSDWTTMAFFVGGILAPLLIPSHDHGH